jgi:hypothetical protein
MALSWYMISRIVPLIAEVLCDVPTRRVGLITGPSSMNREEARLLPDKHTSELGPVDYGRIEVQPFAIERSGTKFALFHEHQNTRTMVGGSNRNR